MSETRFEHFLRGEGGGAAKWYLGNYQMFQPRAISLSVGKEDNSQTRHGMHY